MKHKHTAMNYKTPVIISGVAIITLVIMSVVAFLTMAGIFPGLSTLFNTNEPRDLGVNYTKYDNLNKSIPLVAINDYADAPRKNGATYYVTSPEDVRDGKMSSAQLTAKLNNLTLPWLPVEDIQAKLSTGQVELSGMIVQDKLSNFETYLRERGALNASVQNAFTWARRTNSDVPFYAKLTASMRDGQLTYKLLKVEVGRLAIPLTDIDSNLGREQSVSVESPNFYGESLVLTDDNATFTGIIPTEIYIR